MAQNKLEIELSLDNNAAAGLKKAQKDVEGFSSRARKSFVDLAAKVYLVQQAFRAVSAVMGEMIKAAERQEDATKRLNNALEMQGHFTEETSKRYANFAKELQRSTRYGDEAIQELMQQLISVGNVAPDQMERATQAAIDFAAATGRDLKTAALTVGKAMTGFTGELSRYGIIIDQNIPATEKARAALEAMERQFGGFAQRDVATFSGQVAQLSNKWSDLLEVLGKFITNSSTVKSAIDSIAYAIGFWTEKLEELTTVQVNEKEQDLLEYLSRINAEIEKEQQSLGRNLFGDRAAQEEYINALLLRRAEIMLTIQRLKGEENSIDLERIEVIKQATGVNKDYNSHVITMRDLQKKANKEIAKSTIDLAKTSVSLGRETGQAMQTIRAGEAIINTHAGVTQALAAYPPPQSWVFAAVNLAKGLAEVAAIQAQKFATGGIVTRPTLGLVGEAGPEAIIPLNRAEGSGFGNVNVTINEATFSGRNEVEELAENLGFEIERQLRYARGI